MGNIFSRKVVAGNTVESDNASTAEVEFVYKKEKIDDDAGATSDDTAGNGERIKDNSPAKSAAKST